MAFLPSRHELPASLLGIPYPWVAVIMATLMNTADTWIFSTAFMLYPFIQDELALSQAQMGLISAALLGGGISNLPGGWLSDLWGAKRIVIISLLLMTLPAIGFAASESLWMLIVMGAFIGVISGPVFPASTRVVMDWLPRRKLGIAMGLKQASPSMSGMMAAAIIPTVAVALGWRWTVVAALSLVAVIVVLLISFYRDKPTTGTQNARTSLKGIGELARDRRLLIPVLWATIFAGIQFVFYTYFILFLVQKVELSPVQAGALMGLAQGTSIVGRILWGAASDTIFQGRRLVVLGIMGITACVSYALLSLLTPTSPFYVIAIMAAGHGIASLAWSGLYAVFIGEAAGPGRVGVAIGLTQIIMRLGMVLLPPLFGLLIDITDSYSLAWRLASVIILVMTLGLFILGREPKRVDPPVAAEASR
ncbi:MAG: Nitrate/nitrite transporter NarK [Chloroflexi bacterium]|nr:MAG: Nitrate/nitrite transporter NarK [Chloroflexota bacterium]